MGLLDSVTDLLGQQNGGMPALQGLGAELLKGVLQNQPGGVAGVLGLFKQAGFDKQVASWLASGAHLPVSAEQVHAVLGSHPIVGQLLAQTGLTEADLMAQLAKWLPMIAAQVLGHTGQAPEGGLGGMLGGLLGR
jgi:uncharacterized protein YidB (DUF937 family)